MALFDLRKRRAHRKNLAEAPDAAEPAASAPDAGEAAAPAAAPEAAAQQDAAQAVASAPPPAGAPVPDPGEVALALGEASAPEAPPVVWEGALQDAAVGLLGRGHDVLLFGLGPWGTGPWAQKLLGRVRSVVAIDPERHRLQALRPYSHRTIEAQLDGPEWLRAVTPQRFGTVVLGDALTHAPDPIAVLRRLRSVLAPDGQLVAIVPNAAWGEHRLDLAVGEVPRPHQPGAPRHRYNHDRLRETLAMAGLALTEAHGHRTALFGEGSDLVPELFPEALVEALGGRDRLDDATVSHFVIKAVPATPEALLHTLFSEQEGLRKAVRNELARARRTADALAARLADADEARETLDADLGEHRKKLAGLTELAARADQNIRRLTKEVDDAQRELAEVQSSLAYRILLWLQRKPQPKPLDGPREWKVEEPPTRYR